jgi:F-type H+-transporting ATPase subunit alpha
MNVLKQNQYEPLPVDQQILFLYVVQNRFVENVPAQDLKPLLLTYYHFIETKHPHIIEEIKVKKKFADATLTKLKEITTQFFNKRIA